MDRTTDKDRSSFAIPEDFDPEWYLQTYPDVAQVGMDPVEHYVWIGKRLGRRPNPGFIAASSGSEPLNQASDEKPSVKYAEPAQTSEPASDLARMPRDPARWARLDARIARHRPVPLAPLIRSFNPDAMNLHWIISGELPLNSRQTRAFGLIHHLEAMGHKQWVWIQPPHAESNETAFRAALTAQGAIGRRTIVRFLPEDIIGISGDAVIATDFWSCFPAAAMPLFKARFRLVQFLEDECQLNGSALALARQAKTLDLMAICAGNELWKSFDKTGSWARHWPDFADKRFFFPDPVQTSPSPAEPLHLAINLGEVQASHIATDLTLDALALLGQRDINFTANIFGETPSNFNPSYPFVVHGRLRPTERGNLFRKCQIGVSLATCLDSSTQTEMLACGLDTIGLLHFQPTESGNGLHLVNASSVDIANTILMIANLEKLRQTSAKALHGGQHNMAAQAVEAAFKEGLEIRNQPVTIAQALASTGYEHKAAVIIPTWNGGILFKNVLESLTTQSTPWPFEIMVVDSGSTDETLEITRSYSDRGVRLHTIPNSEFQHGRTRNLAISLTSAEFIAVLTQDATPANAYWLANLVKSFDKGAKVAGVFGAHRAYPEATPFVSHGIEGHFEHFDRLPHVAHWDCDFGDPISFGSISWQNWLHYYSDNNSCMRRSVWEKIPYPDIDWGEDQVWAWEIIKQGYEKAYANDAIVYHSHNLNNYQQAKVSKIEGKFWLQYFNYLFESSSEEVRASVDYLRERNWEFARTHYITNAIRDEQVELDRLAVSSRYSGQVQLLWTLYGNIYYG